MGDRSLYNKEGVMYGLCDCNNFFVSCERVFAPSLNNRPVLVLSSNDGCVIARSEESKALGIQMGVPLFKIKSIVNENNITLFSSNFELYGDMSSRVFETIKEYSEFVEVYSIDEAFIDLRGIELEKLQTWGQNLSKIVKRNVGIPISIGIAPTKTLAKIASKLCKKYPKLNGCCLMYKPEDISKVLSNLEVGEVWGIGRKYTKLLNRVNIYSAEEFRKLSPKWVEKNMSIVGLRTWKELNSEASIKLEDNRISRKSICVSRSFASEICDLDSLTSVTLGFLAKACEKLRKQKSVARSIQVFAWTNQYKENSPQQYASRFIQLPTPTDSTLEMIKFVSKEIKNIYTLGNGYKKSGIILFGIEENVSAGGAIQLPLFEDDNITYETRSKHESIMQTMDLINKKMGNKTIELGRTPSFTSQEYLSRKYTTDWDEILEIKI